jgi:hypothetical protein
MVKGERHPGHSGWTGWFAPSVNGVIHQAHLAWKLLQDLL